MDPGEKQGHVVPVESDLRDEKSDLGAGPDIGSSSEHRSPTSAEFAVRQAKHIVTVAIVVVVAAIAVMILMANVAAFEQMSIAYLVFLFGTVGGIANNYLRLKRLVDNDDAPPLGAAENRLVTLQIYLSPVIGGVFAVVLYGVFFSQFVTGDLFPRFDDCASQSYRGLGLLADCNPDSNAEVAKAFVWAFAAGFLEGLVPNLITGLSDGKPVPSPQHS